MNPKSIGKTNVIKNTEMQLKTQVQRHSKKRN